MLHWIKYFLVSVEQTAILAVNTLQEVLQLKQQTKQVIQQEFGRRVHTGLQLLNVLLQNPVITVDKTANVTGLSYKAANDLVNQMIKENILKETTRAAIAFLFLIAI